MLPTVKKRQNWFPSLFNDFMGNEWITKAQNSSPAMNISESETDYKVEIAAPGMTKNDFSIRLSSNNRLVISMKKEVENNERDENEKYLRREFSITQFQQNLILPDNVNKDAISATLENGLLQLTIPKKEVDFGDKGVEIDIK